MPFYGLYFQRKKLIDGLVVKIATDKLDIVISVALVKSAICHLRHEIFQRRRDARIQMLLWAVFMMYVLFILSLGSKEISICCTVAEEIDF